jgi:hypothetical protein
MIWSYIFLAFTVFVIVSNIALIAYVMFNDGLEVFTDILYTPFCGNPMALKILLIPLQVLYASSWAFPLTIFCLVCMELRAKLNTVLHKLLYIKDSKVLLDNHMNKIRKLFEDVCEEIELTDKTFCVYAGVSLVCNIPLVCFALYMLIWPQQGNPDYIQSFSTFILFISTFLLVVVSWTGGQTNSKVGFPRQNQTKITCIHTVILGDKKISREQSVCMNCMVDGEVDK